MTARPLSIASILWRCLRNDPFDLCFEDSSETLGRRVGDRAVRPTPRQVVGRVFEVFRLAAKALGEPNRHQRPDIRGKIFVVATSDNQLHAVAPVLERLGAVAVLGETADWQRLRRRAALVSLPFLPMVIARSLRATAYQRSTLLGSFANYWLSYGLFVEACRLMRDAPRLVLVTSDHAALQRTVAVAANFMGVRTVFLPHAGVTNGLPPLSYDMAFLDGLHSAQRYAACGQSRTAVFLAGVPRLDAVMQRPRRDALRLGICPGLCDDVETVLDLLSKAVDVMPAAAVTLRPHPREPAKDRYLEAARTTGCVHSDARTEPAGTFLQTVDIVVCGDSNLIMEARVAGRWVVFFDPPGAQAIDQYGYVENGVPHATCRNGADLQAFLSATRTRPTAVGLDFFMATIGTPWEGRSVELVARALFDLSGSRALPGSMGWEARDSTAGTVYFPPPVDLDASPVSHAS